MIEQTPGDGAHKGRYPPAFIKPFHPECNPP
jgi:hypothetical protein